jgi:hypothetical protein
MKTVAWVFSVLLAATLLISVGGFAFLISEQRELVRAFRADDLLMTSVGLVALEAVELGDLQKANATLIQRIFVGLTRLQPDRENLNRSSTRAGRWLGAPTGGLSRTKSRGLF